MLPVSAPFHSRSDGTGAEAPRTGFARRCFRPVALSADHQCRRRSYQLRRRSARSADPPGDATSALARIDSRDDRTRRHDFRRGRARAKFFAASCGRSTAPSAASTWKMPPACTPPLNASPRPAPNPRRISRRKQPRIFPCRATRDPGHSAQGLYAFFRAKQRETSSLRSLNVRTERKVTDSAVSTSRGRRRRSAGLRLLRRIR